MPEDFERCVRNKGKMETVKLSGGRYRHICYDKHGKHMGHIKKRKKKADSYISAKTKKR